MDYATSFQMGHPAAFELAGELSAILPGDLGHPFFVNSGSEAVDTALKIALAFHRRRGEAARTRLIGRERAYHGVGFGGISVGGIGANRTPYGPLLPGVDHLPHTHDPERNAFSRGQPEHGVERADALLDLIALHGAETIAAVIVEPMSGSTGVLVPPVGYLERLREITATHGILLIFDEVITGFGRLGSPFAATHFDLLPDMVTLAKGLTNGTVPMGAVAVRDEIYEAFMAGPEGAIEFTHGYTYSGHPLACAAARAALRVYERDGLLTRAAELDEHWESAAHDLRRLPHVIDIRNIGLTAAIEMAPVPGKPAVRGMTALHKAFQKGAFIRVTGDIIALAPPLPITPAQIDDLFALVAETIEEVADL
jgi:beta-alanine--pyruvate transaminase